MLPDTPVGLAAYILCNVALFVAMRFAVLVTLAAYALRRARRFDADTWDQVDAVNRRLGWRVRRWAARISPRPV